MPDDAPKLVDDRFWLARAANVVEQTSDKLDKGGDRIATATAWFWGAYSTALTAAFALSPLKVSIAMAVLAASPALTLFVAYGLATWAALPVPIQFHVLEPADIKFAHETALARKRRRLRASLGFAALAAVLVATVGLALAVAERPHHAELAITLSDSEILVGGSVPVTGPVAVRVTHEGAPAASAAVAAKKDVVFQVAVPITGGSAYDVEVSWRDDTRTTVIRQMVKVP